MVTKEECDRALDAWRVARDRASLEAATFGTLLKNREALIDSLRENGRRWTAREEFEKFSSAHADALVAANDEEMRRADQYLELRRQYKSQPK